jgi:hypothetical protein
MSNQEQRMASRLRVSGSLIIAGLVVEAASLVRIHPLAFLSFMFLGGGFLVAGIAMYLLSVVSMPPASTDKDRS